MTEQDLIAFVEHDPWMMGVLRTAESLHLPDWMIGAGFLRNRVWDYLHGKPSAEVDASDIDLAYFNPHSIDEQADQRLSERMKGVHGRNWEIVNQAYTHTWHGRSNPYKDTTEAIGEWVETATAVAVTLKNGRVQIIAPHGIDDLVHLIVRPVPARSHDVELFHKRYTEKQWLENGRS